MTPTHLGALTSSPYETTDIAAGQWALAARAISTSGDLSEVVRIANQRLNASRIGPVVWWTGSGAPDASLGKDSDIYLDVTNNYLWQRRNGAWVRLASLAGADGAQWHSGSGAPANSLGKDGDWYFRTGSGAVAGSIYTRVGGAWRKIVDIDQGGDGAQWYSGSVLPSGALGTVGNWYFRTSNGFVYRKTSASRWTFQRDITGPKGKDGKDGISAPRVWTRLYTSGNNTVNVANRVSQIIPIRNWQSYDTLAFELGRNWSGTGSRWFVFFAPTSFIKATVRYSSGQVGVGPFNIFEPDREVLVWNRDSNNIGMTTSAPQRSYIRVWGIDNS